MNKSKLFFASLVFLIIIILWPVLTYISLPEGNHFSEQLNNIHQSPKLYILSFMNALLIAPTLIMALYQFYKKLSHDEWSLKSKLVFSFYLLYFAAISISYASQLFLPFIIDSANRETVFKWYFFNSESAAYMINQTGYLIWAVTTLLIFTKFLFKNTFTFFIIKLLTLSSLTQIVATAALYFGNYDLNGLTLYSGLLLLPTGILILIYSIKTNR